MASQETGVIVIVRTREFFKTDWVQKTANICPHPSSLPHTIKNNALDYWYITH